MEAEGYVWRSGAWWSVIPFPVLSFVYFDSTQVCVFISLALSCKATLHNHKHVICVVHPIFRYGVMLLDSRNVDMQTYTTIKELIDDGTCDETPCVAWSFFVLISLTSLESYLGTHVPSPCSLPSFLLPSFIYSLALSNLADMVISAKPCLVDLFNEFMRPGTLAGQLLSVDQVQECVTACMCESEVCVSVWMGGSFA